MRDDPVLRAAVSLFNETRYLAAHELFEELWESTEGESSDFYKGLIQATICLHHYQEGNPSGARKLYSGHRRYLAAYRPSHLGIDVEDFLQTMQRALGPLVRARAGEEPTFDPDARPLLEITDEDV